MGYGLDNLDDIVNALNRIATAFRTLRKGSGLSETIKAHLDEDILLVNYTRLILSLHHAFALYWEANRYGRRGAAAHRRRLLAVADKLARLQLPADAVGEVRERNALERSGLAGPLKRAFGYSPAARVARIETETGAMM